MRRGRFVVELVGFLKVVVEFYVKGSLFQLKDRWCAHPRGTCKKRSFYLYIMVLV